MSKVSFRARALDVAKHMPVFTADELPDLGEYAAINRAVAQMPTGMEKDEEMELHLQEAISAQQAHNAGITNTDNHVIPTPKVRCIDQLGFDTLYPPQPAPSKNQLIKVQAALTIDKELPEYDLDSEDDAWLRGKAHINADDFERLMDLLEGASGEQQICQPKEARILLSNYDDQMVDDVYDYWLQKRKAAAQNSVQSLIARVKSESRRDGAVNPSIAFRRRAEKMQTRKNRKNDEDSYEKILKLSHDLRKAVTLFEMVKRREKSKLALLDLDVDVFDRRVQAQDFSSALFNELLQRVKPDFQFSSAKDPTERKSKARKRKASRAAMDKDLVSHAWLKQNAEDWNRPASVFPPSPGRLGAQKQTKEAVDGRFAFKRRRGCLYRAPQQPGVSDEAAMMAMPPFNRAFLPSRSGVLRCVGLARRRIGRGGRVVFDRITGAGFDDYLSASSACSSSYRTLSRMDSTGVFSSADSSSSASQKSVYFRPCVLAPQLNDVEDGIRSVGGSAMALPSATNDEGAALASYAALINGSETLRIPIKVGVSDRLFVAHRRRLALGELCPTRPSQHPHDADPMQQCPSVAAFSASAAVMSELGVTQLMVGQQQKLAVQRQRTAEGEQPRAPSLDHMYQQQQQQTAPAMPAYQQRLAVVAAAQQTDVCKKAGTNHNHNNNNNGHDQPSVRKRQTTLSTDPAPAVQALNFPSSAPQSANEFPVAARTHLKQKAVVSPMESLPAPTSVSSPEDISKLMTQQDSMEGKTNGDLEHSQQIARPVR